MKAAKSSAHNTNKQTNERPMKNYLMEDIMY